MKRALSLTTEIEQVASIQTLAGLLENVSSLRISRLKDQVLNSKNYFAELWAIYTQLRRLPKEAEDTITDATRPKKQALIVVTSEGGLSGDIDRRIITTMQPHYQTGKTEIVVLGSHGATLLAQLGLPVKEVFRLPENDSFNPLPVINLLRQFSQPIVFYQTYLSLTRQEVAQLNLVSAVRSLGTEGQQADHEAITSHTYVFEPSAKQIIDFMESVMLQIALSQVVWESRLASYASRFQAMHRAGTKAKDLGGQLRRDYLRARRSEADERLRETNNAKINR